MREWDFEPGLPGSLRARICEWGDDGGKPTVILHGFLEQGAAWDAVARRLPGRIVAPDHRGHGRSGHVGAGGFYHFWDYVGDLDLLVEALAPDGAAIDLVGHSMGGTIACLYAGARPDRVRRLVLVEGLGPPDTTAQAVARARQFLSHRREPPQHRAFPDASRAAARMRHFNPSIPGEVASALAERTLQPTDGGVTWTWDPLHRARSPVPFSAQIFEAFLREIRAPTLVVDGGDSVFAIPDAAERLAALADARRVVVPEAGHLVHHDQPDALAALIREWLSPTARTS